jgi:hypothetical protein
MIIKPIIPNILELRKDRKEKLIQAKKNQDAEIKQMEDNINSSVRVLLKLLLRNL